MWWLLFGGDDADFDFFKSGILQPSMQITFGETEPAVAIKLPSFFEIMLEQIQQEQLPAWAKNFMCACNGFGGIGGVMERLAQDRQINAVRFDGWIL